MRPDRVFGRKVQGIYCFTNKINNKKYIGLSTNISKRINEHRNRHKDESDVNYNGKFYRALRKYGFDNFEFNILEEVDDLDILKKQEKYWINFYNSKNNGYNMTSGGEDNPMFHEESRKKIRGSNSGRALLTDEDVFSIREAYLNKQKKMDVYALYKDQIKLGGFDSIWWGQSYPDIHMDVYIQRPKDTVTKGKLHPEEVLDIRLLYMSGVHVNDIAKKYSIVKREQIRKILFLERGIHSSTIPENYIPPKRGEGVI